MYQIFVLRCTVKEIGWNSWRMFVPITNYDPHPILTPRSKQQIWFWYHVYQLNIHWTCEMLGWEREEYLELCCLWDMISYVERLSGIGGKSILNSDVCGRWSLIWDVCLRLDDLFKIDFGRYLFVLEDFRVYFLRV